MGIRFVRTGRSPTPSLSLSFSKDEACLSRSRSRIALCNRVPMTIRVVTDRWLNVQRMYQYRCEVISRRSAYRGNVDTLFSEDVLLKAGHTYQVRLNDDPKRPRIVKCYREVLPKDDGSRADCPLVSELPAREPIARMS